ncbi:MAG TPA: hypothetical protein VFO55_13670 [Gemmatimonadaceae bacterium]|nr:hypothetical protein [Gemmatimonadaceae bacterium]
MNPKLQSIDGRRLAKEYRDALSPGGVRCDSDGIEHRLPRFFYEIPSWDYAMAMRLTPNFGLWELVQTDVREAPILQSFPRYVPCSLPLLAFALEQFRAATGTFVHIAANGGYRSPGHELSCTAGATTHCWGTAVNIYRIGDTLIDNRDVHEKYAQMARESIPGVYVRAFGSGRGEADDHLHIDLGYVVTVPHGIVGARGVIV